ncbi:plasmid replication protein RepB, partial [Aeromonas veronii]
MQEKEAKTVFDMGGFSKAMIVPTPMGSGFHLHLVRFGKAGTEVVERQRGGWRVFSSI